MILTKKRFELLCPSLKFKIGSLCLFTTETQAGIFWSVFTQPLSRHYNDNKISQHSVQWPNQLTDRVSHSLLNWLMHVVFSV